jgi:hypothetical protein
VHRASSRAPQSTSLLRTLRALHGKLVVVNQGRRARLPFGVASAVRAIVRDGPRVMDAASQGTVVGIGVDTRAHAETRRARELLAEYPHGAATLRAAPHRHAVALYGPSGVRVRRSAGVTNNVAESFVADVPYRLAIFVGAREGAGPRESLGASDVARSVADAPAWTWRRSGAPAAWFVADVLLPDDDALRQMTADAAMAYARATGRQGAGSVDRYWHLPAWERFEEPGRVVGYVTPDAVASGAGSVLGTAAPASRLTPTHDRAALVPPGYCLVRCVGTLEVAVLRLA